MMINRRQFSWWIKRLAGLFIAAIIVLIILIFLIDRFVGSQTQSHIYENIDSLPHRKTGVLLGTSKYVTNGKLNLFYSNRINAAIALFEAGKIEYIIVSGDNRYLSYNEPKLMMQDLISAGVPAERIIPDYAGFRTFDSVIRSKKVFTQDSVIIISQAFHLERAIYIAQQNDLSAIGFAADFPNHNWAYKVLLREYLARIALMLDVYVLNTKPKFLGEEIPIGRDSL